MKTTSLLLLILSITLSLFACASVGPDYQQPHLNLPSDWQSARNGKLADVSAWWASFQDPVLNTLLDAAQKDNPTLVKAAAAIEKARANRSSVNAGFLPTIDAQASATRSGSLRNDAGTSTAGTSQISSSGSLQAGVASTRSSSVGLSSSWEIDLFGKIRRSSESAGALEQAREVDWYGARISLVAEVASIYIDYRACRLKQKYYEEQAGSQSKTSELTALSAKAGFTAPADVRLADASAAGTRSAALGQQAECEVLVKALVALTGMTEPSVRQTLGQDTPSLPQPEGFMVTAVPADLLRQRPDIVSAERTLASASALIGVAEAAHYPSFSLSGSVGLSSADGTNFQPWSFGPTLTLPIFSGGRIKAGVRSAKADYESALADYKQAVRDAVKEVEQSLVRLDIAVQREQEARTSAEGYRAYQTATEQNWRVGRSSLLDLEVARRAAITAEVNLLELQQNRLQYWIALYKAVGGGWKSAEGESK